MDDQKKAVDSVHTMDSQSQMSKKRLIIENVVALGLSLFLVLMVRSSVIEAFKIPSGSMIPTLLIGDHIFVNKFAYGFKVPLTEYFLEKPVTVIPRDPPKRGDIIVFIYPKDETYYYIKRVVGTPGDTIEIRNKVLYVNGQPIQREALSGEDADKIFNSLDDPRYSKNNLELFKETMGDDSHTIMLDKNNFLGDSFGPEKVPADSLFVMGDNRDFSNDSRFWGFVPFKNVKGKAMVTWFSIWIDFKEKQFLFRPSRIGTILH